MINTFLYIDIIEYYITLKMYKLDLHVSKKITFHNIILSEKIKIKEKNSIYIKFNIHTRPVWFSG